MKTKNLHDIVRIQGCDFALMAVRMFRQYSPVSFKIIIWLVK